MKILNIMKPIRDHLNQIVLALPMGAAVFLFALLLGASSASATAITSAGSGNWNSTTTWSPAQVPVVGDDVTLASGFTVTVTADAACGTAVFPTGTSATLNINSGVTLSVSGLITLARSSSGNNTLAVGNGFLNAGSISWPNGGTTQRHFLTINTGTVTVAGDVYTVANTTTSAVVTFTGAGLLKVGGAFFTGGNGGGTLNKGTGTVEYNGSAAQTVKGFSYNNLTLSGSDAKSMDSTVSVTGKLTIAPTGTAVASVVNGNQPRVNLLTLGAVDQPSGTFGSTLSAATHKNDTYFDATKTGTLFVAVDPTPTAKDILTFGPGAVVNESTILWNTGLPYGSALTALSPTYTVSATATPDATYPSGTTRDISTPKTYTINDQFGGTKTYTVTATTGSALNYRSYDTSYGTSMLNPIANLLAVTPSATGVQTTDIYYPSTFAGFPGITADDTFSVVWDGWLDVKASGYGDYTFGVASDDGSVVYADLNDDGVFDPATELIVNNNADQGTTTRTGTVNLTMDQVHVLFGFYQNGGGLSMEARYAKGTAVPWASMPRVGAASPFFSPTMIYGLTKPLGLKAVAGDSLVALTWTAFPGATSYNVKRWNPSTSVFDTIGTPTGNSFTDNTAINGTNYRYVVSAMTGAVESQNSDEVNATPSPVDAGLSTVVGYLPQVWADGVAISTVTVSLKNGGGNPAAGKTVTLVSDRGASDTISAGSNGGVSDTNGKVTFTVKSLVVGTANFTAADTTDSTTITQKGSVVFKTKPADLTAYLPGNLPPGGSVNLLQTWNAGTGWADWSDWDVGNTYDVDNNKVLGTVGGARGAMYLYDTRTKLPAMSYFNSGIEVTYIGSDAPRPGAAAWAELLTWDGQDGPGRKGFIIKADNPQTGSVQTYAMTADGQGPSQNWPTTDTLGLHTMTLLRFSNGDVQGYVDGVLKSTMTGTPDPGRALTMLGFGYEYTGNCFVPRGTIVEQVKAFTVSYTVGAPDAGTSTVAVSPATMRANGTDTSTVTVTLKDAAGYRVAGKEVTLSSAGPGAVTITSPQTTDALGVAVFTVQPTTTTPGMYEFTATVTSPAVVITQKATLNTTLTIATTVLDVSGSGTGLEILNDGILVEANHFGSTGIGSVKVNGVTFGTNWGHLSSEWNPGQATSTDSQTRVPSLTDATDYGKLMREYIWNSASTARVDIPGLTVGNIYRLQWITSSPRGGNISVEGSASVPLAPTTQPASNYPMLFAFTWVATDTTANVLVTRQSGSYNSDNELLFNGYALHDMGSALTDYGTWAAGYGLTGANALPGADPDGDGLSNFQEYAFGLNPTSGSSCNPITVPLNKTGTFSYTRRATPATTGLTYTVETSIDLEHWTADAGAMEGPITTAGDVQTVPVTLSPALLTELKLFVRVTASN